MRLVWLSPGDPAQRTGGYLWNARMVDGLRARGVGVDVLPVAGEWPFPGGSGAELEHVRGDLVVADGLCWPGLGEAGRALARRHPVVVVVHSLLCRETEGPPEQARALDALEVGSWAGVRALVATSALTAEALGARTALPVATVVPGTERAARAAGGDGRTLLTVGTLTPRKGHDRLFDALGRVPGTWRLVCAGAPRDPVWAARLAADVARRGWGDRVTFAGDLDGPALAEAYARADVVVQAARYEAFGMAIAEAVARGLPVVTPEAGVVHHLPPGAVRVPRDLADAVGHLLSDASARRAQADAAWAAAAGLPDWDTQAGALAAALTTVTARRARPSPSRS